MKIMKIRRVGNSNVISIPRDLEAHGFVPGTMVVIDEMSRGELRLTLEHDVRSRIREVGRQAIDDNRETLELLEQHDREGSGATSPT
jgi:antitoxin component of MazEF toxin-antitoxin module